MMILELLGRKWIQRTKNSRKRPWKSGEIQILVSRKGYSQVEGIDFGEIFSHVAKLTSIIFILSVVVSFYFEVEQMDVKTTFLHGDLEEEIYMKQPKGFASEGKERAGMQAEKFLVWVKEITKDVV
jgi:hypothetical protein